MENRIFFLKQPVEVQGSKKVCKIVQGKLTNKNWYKSVEHGPFKTLLFLQDAIITAVKHRGNKYASLLKGLCVWTFLLVDL